jgi:hypothetical protein
VGGDDGGKVDVGEAVADTTGNGGGSVKDQSVHGGSAKSVEKCEAEQGGSPDDDDGKKAVDGDGITEEPNPAGNDNDQDEPRGDTDKAVDGNDVAKESDSSAKSLKEDKTPNSHSGETETKETAEATAKETLDGGDGAKAVDRNDIAEEPNSTRDNNQEGQGGPAEAKESAETVGEKAGEKAVDVTEGSNSANSLEEDKTEDGQGSPTAAKETRRRPRKQLRSPKLKLKRNPSTVTVLPKNPPR